MRNIELGEKLRNRRKELEALMERELGAIITPNVIVAINAVIVNIATIVSIYLLKLQLKTQENAKMENN